MNAIARYGVRLANPPGDAVEEAAESLRLLGYALVDSGLDAAAIERLRARFDALRAAQRARFGAERLARIGEADMIRCPLAEEAEFLALAANPVILALCERMMGPGFILNQQNGIVNPAHTAQYAQSPYHRDLPYQHYVSSRPLAINALLQVPGGETAALRLALLALGIAVLALVAAQYWQRRAGRHRT